MRAKTGLVWLVVLLFLSSSVGNGQTLQPGSALESVLEAYQSAIRDAAVPKPEEVSATLTAIDRSNPGLVWDEHHSHILVVSWKSLDSFKRFYEKEKTTSRDEDNVTWVTVVPEVQGFCRDYLNLSRDAEAVSLRLKQYLGLNPTWQYDVFVEMWVRPDDVFRPCPDPEITDSVCKLELSGRPPAVRHIKNYNAFYKSLYYKSFRSSSSAPWTGLGYTYDWGNPVEKRGASEFILVPKARYAIRQVVPTKEYCSVQ
jgi:hypothetical protein